MFSSCRKMCIRNFGRNSVCQTGSGNPDRTISSYLSQFYPTGESYPWTLCFNLWVALTDHQTWIKGYKQKSHCQWIGEEICLRAPRACLSGHVIFLLICCQFFMILGIGPSDFTCWDTKAAKNFGFEKSTNHLNPCMNEMPLFGPVSHPIHNNCDHY